LPELGWRGEIMRPDALMPAAALRQAAIRHGRNSACTDMFVAVCTAWVIKHHAF